VISAGLNAAVGHAVSLQDIDGVQYWLPMAVAFRRNIKLSLDVHRIADQLRHRSILGTDLVPDISPEPAVDRPSSIPRCSAWPRSSQRSQPFRPSATGPG
jgi:hypothetical protein